MKLMMNQLFIQFLRFLTIEDFTFLGWIDLRADSCQWLLKTIKAIVLNILTNYIGFGEKFMRQSVFVKV